MHSSFYSENRQSLYDRLDKGSLAVVFSGTAPRQTNDQYYPYFTDRNFLYFTGISQCDSVLMCAVGDLAQEKLFIPSPDPAKERWNGLRVKALEATEISGITEIGYTKDYEVRLNELLGSGNYSFVYLPLFKHTADEPDSPAYVLARYINDRYPHIIIKDLMPHIKALRLIKKPCEIEAIRRALEVTREGILAMMRASKPGVMEYELKAEFDYVLTKRGILSPASTPIISGGENNFLIHYNSYTGQINDGDFVLCDVGAMYDNLMNDVSRGWPCNGKFSERQKLLYNCALDTSKHMFSIIKPGMPMGDVDATIRRYNYERLRDIGLCKSYDEVGKYMWHGGAHHVGFDVHDVVAITPDTPIAAGMVFCVDIGIYVEDWGIGFRLEDNCLITEDGCENMSNAIPYTIEDIEAVMEVEKEKLRE